MYPAKTVALSAGGKTGKIPFRGELALCIVAVLNSFAVELMLYSGAGTSSISATPYALPLILPGLSLGTWTYIFQTTLVAVLMLPRKRFVPEYLLAFAVGMAFSKMLDVHALWMTQLPLTPLLRCVYFTVSFAALTVGIALSNHCKLPIIPTDLFPRELAQILRCPYQRVKTLFDLGCLTVTVVLMAVFVHHLAGIGVGTVLCALAMGRSIAWMGRQLDRYFVFHSFLERSASRQAL